MSKPPPNRCFVCQKPDSPEYLVLINIRNKGKIIKQEKVHPACYQKDPEWVMRQLKGRNPKYFMMGKQIK